MKTTFIYALCEPGTRTVRYIGKADRPRRRFKRHLNESIGYNSYLGRWLRSLEGAAPVLEILDEVPDCQHDFWEREYIRVFRALGMRLVNTTDGGASGSILKGKDSPMFGRTGKDAPHFGKPHSLETRRAISKSLEGKVHSAKTRKLMSESHKGLVRTPEHRAALSKVLVGRPLTPEHCEALSKAHSGIPWSEKRRTAFELKKSLNEQS